MNYDYADLEFAMCGVGVLVIILGVAVVAYLKRSRLMLVCGAVGTLLGFVMPFARLNIRGPLEDQIMGQLESDAQHVFGYGVQGALIGCASVGLLALLTRKHAQFSLRQLFSVMTAVAVLLALLFA